MNFRESTAREDYEDALARLERLCERARDLENERVALRRAIQECALDVQCHRERVIEAE